MSRSSNGRAGSWRRADVRAAPNLEPGHVGLGPGLVDERQSRRIDALLMAWPAPAMALYVRTILLARDKRLFLSVTPMRRKKRLIIAVSARTHAPPPVAKRLQGDVGFLRSQRFEKLTMRIKPRTEVSAHLARRPPTAPFEVLHPLDGRGVAHPKRAAAARRLISPPTTASITRSRKSCEYALAIPAGLRPASKLIQNNADLLADLARSCATMRACRFLAISASVLEPPTSAPPDPSRRGASRPGSRSRL